ncbi:MAG: prepilin peptidase [Planctomycetota bacterium]|nr:prepilin peptidase [Planctomycetota bacterium]MDA1105071.1 prepilin peptidase [Planctomycetota bacterium]
MSTIESILPAAVEGFFALCVGAAVGSFVNVIAYRVPLGLSVIRPASRCPECGKALGWSENLPIIGWLFLLGKCRGCRQPISVQYPLIELGVGLFTAWLYLTLFHTEQGSWWGSGTSSWWRVAGLLHSLPAVCGLVVFIGGMAAVALCDAARYLVPMSIVRWVAGIGVASWVIQAHVSIRPVDFFPPIPLPPGAWMGAALGGGLGVLIANGLLRVGTLRRSFADYDDFVAEGETLGDYPHARREMGPEAAFLGLVGLGALAGWCADSWLSPIREVASVQVLSACCAGFLVGGGIVWIVRILGTLAFGREAMGLGDVHILAAAGAVLGWRDPLLAFVLAPFPALLWTVGQRCLRPPGSRRELPFGPYLVIGLAVVLVLRPVLVDLGQLLHWIPGETAQIHRAFG